MAIHLAPNPEPALRLVRRYAPSLLAATPAHSRMRAMAARGPEIRISHPFHLFVATVAGVMTGHLLRDVMPGQHRVICFLVYDREPFAMAEINGDELSHFNEGPLVAGSVAAMHAAERYAGGSALHHELRVLSIPFACTSAIWLAAAGQDVLFPIHPAPPPLTPNEPYDEARFTAALRPLVQQHRAARGRPE